MKNLIKSFSFYSLSFFALLTLCMCSKKDSPTNNDFFAGTYTGNISYTDGAANIINVPSGKVFVTKIVSGTKYNFAFSNSIPDINGVEFNKSGDKVLISVDATSSIYIRIDENVLKILYFKDGKSWTADCNR